MSETIVNLTPHAIRIPVTGRPDLGEWTLEPSGTVARATEDVRPAASIGYIPTCVVTFGAPEGLPDPQWTTLPSPCDEPGAVPEGSRFCLVCGAQDGHHAPPRAPAVYYVVSSITADAARRSGRSTEDLLVPGTPIRDPSGRVIGCQSLARVV